MSKNEAIGLRVKAWKTWQGSAVSAIHRKRASRKSGGDETGNPPVVLSRVVISASLDDRFERFASILGPKRARSAETFLVRILQYAAHHGAANGDVRVPAKMFGTLVLSRKWDMVSALEGKRVFAAIIEAGMADELRENARNGTPRGTARETPLEVNRSEVKIQNPPSPGSGGGVVASLPSDPELDPVEAMREVVITWATRRAERKGPHHERAKGTIRANTEKRLRVEREFAWIEQNDPDMLRKVQRSIRRALTHRNGATR